MLLYDLHSIYSSMVTPSSTRVLATTNSATILLCMYCTVRDFDFCRAVRTRRDRDATAELQEQRTLPFFPPEDVEKGQTGQPIDDNLNDLNGQSRL